MQGLRLHGPIATGLFCTALALTIGCSDACGNDPECGADLQVVSHYTGLESCETVPVGSFMIAARDAWCSPKPACGTRLRPGDRFADPAVCAGWVTRHLLEPHGVPTLIAAVQAKQVSYDKHKACQCLAAVGASCLPVGLFDASGACNGIFLGHQLTGQKCSHHGQCAGGSCRPSQSPFSPSCPGNCDDASILGGDCGASQACVAGAGCLHGSCVAMTSTSAADQPCGGLGCGAGLFCSWAAGATCQPLHAPDAACDLDEGGCSAGRYCAPDIAPSAVGRICAARYAAGQLCQRDAGERETCVAGHVCAGTCLPYAGLGQDCSKAEQCNEDAACVDGKCRALPGLAMPCDAAVVSATGDACKPPGLCDSGLGDCVEAPGAGAACVLGQCAADLACVQGKCSAGPGVGQACASAGNACASGLICVAGSCQQEKCH